MNIFFGNRCPRCRAAMRVAFIGTTSRQRVYKCDTTGVPIYRQGKIVGSSLDCEGQHYLMTTIGTWVKATVFAMDKKKGLWDAMPTVVGGTA